MTSTRPGCITPSSARSLRVIASKREVTSCTFDADIRLPWMRSESYSSSPSAIAATVVTDPAKGLLPPDNAQGAGRGFVTYTVEPKGGLATGIQISAMTTMAAVAKRPMRTNSLWVALGRSFS